jgi:hypothetical protein
MTPAAVTNLCVPSLPTQGIAFVAVAGTIVAAVSLFAVAGGAKHRPTRTDPLTLLRQGFANAWPIYWLWGYLLIDAALAWPALVTTAATITLLPMTLYEMFSRRVGLSTVSPAMSVFFAIAVAMLFVLGIGFDRTFGTLDAHFVTTIFLLAIWWSWHSTIEDSDGSCDEPMICAPTSWRRRLTRMICVPMYHLAALAMLASSEALTMKLGFPRGIVLGLLLAFAWTPATIRRLRHSTQPASTLLARTLAILFGSSVIVLLVGVALAILHDAGMAWKLPTGYPIVFPLTLWQMEVGLLLMTAVLFVGRQYGGPRRSIAESLMLILVYAAYLTMRIYRLYS